MQFIRLHMAIDMAKRVLPEQVSDSVNTKSVQIIDNNLV